MKKFLNILQKEIKDLLTLKMLLPFIISLFILLFVGQLMQIEMVMAMKPTNIVIIDNDKTQSSQYLIDGLKRANYIINLADAVNDTQAVRIAKKKNCALCVVILPNYELNLKNKNTAEIRIYSVITSLSIASAAQKVSIKNILRTINQQVAESFIKELSPDLKPEVFREPIKAQEFVVLKDMIQPGSAASIIAYISNQTTVVPVALVLLIIITGTMIASSIAQEKENKTLETILTVPVSRFTIVLAKMLAAVILAIVFAFFFTVVMGSFIMPLSNPAATIPTDMQYFGQHINLSLDGGAKILLGLNIFLSIVNALTMATLLALFAQDVKDAQSTIMPLTIMIFIPYFFALMFDPGLMSLGLKIFTFLIPFSHTFFAFKFLILGQRLPVILGIIYLFLFAIGLLITATKIVSSEHILTMKFNFGRIRKLL